MSDIDELTASYPVRRALPFSNRFRNVTLGHLDNFEGGQYSERNLTSVLFEGRGDSSEHVQMEAWSAPGLSKPLFDEAIKQQYQPISKGHRFGPSWSNHWVRLTARIPKDWQKKERVQLEFDPSCEAMIFNPEGLPLQGITGGYDGDRRVEYIIPTHQRSSPVHLYIEITANMMFGISSDGNIDPNRYFTLESADIVVPRMEAWNLLWDFRIIKDITRNLPTNSALGAKAQTVAMDIANAFRHDDLSTIATCRKLAEQIFGRDWQAQGAGIYSGGTWDGKGGNIDVPVFGIGNCHIDTAWLWPFRATQQKSARSWSTQIDLMERYEEYRFVASQAQQFKWVEQLYPSLFERIKKKVQDKSFQPIGGSWVESDTNMPSGEALCRQFLFGQRYFKSRFGEYCTVYWLPDSFGYCGNLPQICRLAGMPFFFTQKLSWSQFNTFPHSTFNWIGIDGTQLFVHMTPVDTYTAQANVAECIKAVNNHKDLEWTSHSLLTYGNGDGGGGPLPPMLESLRRIRAAANESPDLPKVTQGRSVPEFFANLLRDTNNGERLPTWRGELYVEYHRGTYTSHGSIKRHNRKSEVLLRDLEFAATMACLYASKSYDYPKADIDSLWEDDVLPGSAIAMVYEDAEQIYAGVAERGGKLMEKALRALLPDSIPLSRANDGNCNPVDVVALNTLSFPRQEIVKIPLACYDGTSLFTASNVDQESGFILLRDDGDNEGLAQPVNMTVGSLIQPAQAYEAQGAEGTAYYVLANSTLTVQVSAQGRITSIKDTLLNREVLAPGTTAGLVKYRDEPLNFEAWDIDIFALEYDNRVEVNASSVKVSEPGGLRASLTMTFYAGNTTIIVELSVDAIAASLKPDSLSLIRFDTVVDFHEHRVIYKFELPLDINTDHATYEIQYGTISRPTHQNTTWDKAKFEVCAHRFADLSEYGYGCALIKYVSVPEFLNSDADEHEPCSDSKYGHSARGNVLNLTLLKGAQAPDHDQDQGQHTMSWAILPHRSSFLQSDVPRIATAFNYPLHLRFAPRTKLNSATSFPGTLFSISGAENVFLDCVKRGEDDHFTSTASTDKVQKTVILRFYEAFGGKANVIIQSKLKLERAYIVDILERFQDEITLDEQLSGEGSRFTLQLQPFQIQTVCVVIGKASK